MQLRRVKKASGTPQYAVQAYVEDGWRELSQVEGLDDIAKNFSVADDLASDLLAVLALGKSGWDALTDALKQCPAASEDAQVVLPFEPASFRDFMLFEKHFNDSARGHARRYMPGAFKVASIFERLTGKTFPMFRPKPIWYQQPLYYFGNHLNFVADGEELPWPNHVQDLDYELELGAIVSRPVINATKEEASEAIGGYVLINDLSARGQGQRDQMASGFGPQKCKHFANAMATTVITADELEGQEDQLSGRVTINGQVVANCSSEGMQFSFAEVVSFLSQGEQLHPGELLGSGTLPGGGGLENGHWLRRGDKLSLELDGVGTLSNPVAN